MGEFPFLVRAPVEYVEVVGGGHGDYVVLRRRGIPRCGMPCGVENLPVEVEAVGGNFVFLLLARRVDLFVYFIFNYFIIFFLLILLKF